jgi:magnesium chelatase family protein
MNPCRCGHLGEAGRECGRAPRCGEEYLAKLSGPLLDRIDLTVYALPVAPAELSRAPPGERSEIIALRVAAARALQRARAGPGMPATNAELDGARIALVEDARKLAEHAAERLGLSARGFTRVLRVARTIADLAGAPTVRRQDVAEALAFRHRIPGRKAA